MRIFFLEYQHSVTSEIIKIFVMLFVVFHCNEIKKSIIMEVKVKISLLRYESTAGKNLK